MSSDRKEGVHLVSIRCVHRVKIPTSRKGGETWGTPTTISTRNKTSKSFNLTEQRDSRDASTALRVPAVLPSSLSMTNGCERRFIRSAGSRWGRGGRRGGLAPCRRRSRRGRERTLS